MTDKSTGMDRREFIRRSAIVGGTVAWMTPVIQSLSPPAFADDLGSTYFCCDCRRLQGGTGANPCPACTNSISSAEECETFCANRSNESSTCVVKGFHSSNTAMIQCNGTDCSESHD